MKGRKNNNKSIAVNMGMRGSMGDLRGDAESPATEIADRSFLRLRGRAARAARWAWVGFIGLLR